MLGLERAIERRDETIEELNERVMLSEKALAKMTKKAQESEESIRLVTHLLLWPWSPIVNLLTREILFFYTLGQWLQMSNA